MANYIIIDGYEYEVGNNPTDIELGEYQDRNYGYVEKLIDKTFDIDENK